MKRYDLIAWLLGRKAGPVRGKRTVTELEDLLRRFRDAFTDLDANAAEAFCQGIETGAPSEEVIEAMMNAVGKIKRLRKELESEGLR